MNVSFSRVPTTVLEASRPTRRLHSDGRLRRPLVKRILVMC